MGVLGGTTVQAAREQKFIALDGTIEDLSRAAERLEGLISEMQNGPVPIGKDKPIQQQPVFQTVYDEAPGHIREITERIRKATEDLRSRLF